MSRPPKRRLTSANMPRTAALSETSAWWAQARSRRAPIAATVASAASRFSSLMITRAPSLAKRIAVARPMPEPAPVTRAIRPSSLMRFSRFAAGHSQYMSRAVRNNAFEVREERSSSSGEDIRFVLHAVHERSVFVGMPGHNARGAADFPEPGIQVTGRHAQAERENIAWPQLARAGDHKSVVENAEGFGRELKRVRRGFPAVESDGNGKLVERR